MPVMFDGEPLDVMSETGRWRTRDVSYWSGCWQQLRTLLPYFELQDFKAAPDATSNPYMRAVVRRPRTRVEQPVPVGVVSNSYFLLQHEHVADRCFAGVRMANIDPDALRCELGLSELGEWMNLRVYFPDSYSYPIQAATGDRMALRLECFNSVDGSSRLLILFGWFRFVCSNGLVIGDTVAEVRDIHDQNLDIEPIAARVRDGLQKATEDLSRLNRWTAKRISIESLVPWTDQAVARIWGPKAAGRVLHICRTGHDAELADPFARGTPSEKAMRQTSSVPGSPVVAATLFDVSQALAWVATKRRDPEARVEWQRQIPSLVDELLS